MLNFMIQQNSTNENTLPEINIQFIKAIRELKISTLLKQSNICKTSRSRNGDDGKKRTAFEIFQFLLMLVFEGTNLFRFLGSKKQDIACAKSTYYRFLSNCHYNWRRFLLLLSGKAAAYFSTLTRPERVKCFVLDDSVIPRAKSKKVELLSFVYDHVIHKTVRGFNLLLLGWTDGYSFLPVTFNMLASANEEKRINPVNKSIDRRTNGAKVREDAVMKKPEAAAALIHNALEAGIEASCVLMDTWFTNEPFIHAVLNESLDVIGMVKDNKQQYRYRGKLLGLKELVRYMRVDPIHNILGSVSVYTKKYNIAVKLVFIRNRNKKDEYIVLLSTDCSLSASEIVRRYGNRWPIECCFKACKSLLKLGKEFHGVSYDLTVSSAALVFTRFILLEWIRRKHNDDKTIAELFFVCCEDIQDMEYSTALRSLMSIFTTGIRNGSVIIDETVRMQLIEWFVSQPAFIQSIFPEFMNGIGRDEGDLSILQVAYCQ